ncbi:M15 family metallopeptidase [Demequina litorisediminis]|uniref:D-alanyl-D-alanine carboxypeptidase n=1 Tax=Demequina litorisediminis TaxID=1849022 RepID=A0ABQ6I9V5_9MICO|nr:M15 family metallopeptidase [Demequina litorisediminis]GMA34236.1 hypothetical protein GCM10025876_04400 [Demequina litorisediminis]
MRNGLLPATALCPLPWDVTEALACPAAAGLETLNAAFRAQFGQDIPVADAYRSLAGQRAARADRGWLAAQPGTSMHGWGAAIDLSPSQARWRLWGRRVRLDHRPRTGSRLGAPRVGRAPRHQAGAMAPGVSGVGSTLADDVE